MKKLFKASFILMLVLLCCSGLAFAGNGNAGTGNNGGNGPGDGTGNGGDGPGDGSGNGAPDGAGGCPGA